MKKLILLIPLCLVAAGCGVVGSDDVLGEMTVERAGEDGIITVIRDGETTRVEDRFGLEPGDLISTEPNTQAKLRLQGDRRAWIAGATEARVVDGTTIQTRRGSVLADANDPMTVTVGDIEASSTEGLYRIDRRAASARVGVYSGTATLDAPGRAPVKVDTYFQAPIAGGEVLTAEPYSLDPADPWDGLWLEDVVALNSELEQLGAGFSGQVGRLRPELDYFRMISKGKNVDFVHRFLRRRPADLLIGFTIASNDSRNRLPASFREAFGLHDDGAVWGLVAAIMRVEGRATVAALEELIVGTGVAVNGGASADFTFASGGGGPGGPGGSDGGAPPGTGGVGGDDDGGGGDGDGDGDGGGGDGDDGGGGGGDECENLVDCIVEDPPLPLPEESPGLDIELP